MRRLVLPVLLIIASVAAFRYSDQRGEQTQTAVSSDDVVSPTTPVISARRVPEVLNEPRAKDEVALQLNDIATRSPQLSCLVAHDSEGDELFASNPDVGLVPASVQKLVTASAALEQFGPDARLRTTLAGAVDPVDGVIDGDVYLIGGGDPLLHTEAYVASFPTTFPHSRFEDLADAFVSAGVTQINGGVIAYEARYDAVRQPTQWDEDGNLARDGFTGPLSALMVNDGFTSFPEVREPGVFPSPADDPAIHAASVLDDLLEERGVIIGAGSRNDTELPPDIVELAAIESLPMGEIVAEMLTFSDNTTAELLLKEIGFTQTGEGSTDAGALAALEILGTAGADITAMRIIDGSGLSNRNRISCRAVIDILDSAGLDSVLGQGLAVGGRNGTLRDRYNQPPLRNAVHAKTGSLNAVTALAGFVETKPGDVVSFSYLMNLEPEITEELIALQEEMLRDLVEYPTGPSIEELEPLGPDREPAAPYIPGAASSESTSPDESGAATAVPEPTPAADDDGGGLGPDE